MPPREDPGENEPGGDAGGYSPVSARSPWEGLPRYGA